MVVEVGEGIDNDVVVTVNVKRAKRRKCVEDIRIGDSVRIPFTKG